MFNILFFFFFWSVVPWVILLITLLTSTITINTCQAACNVSDRDNLLNLSFTSLNWSASFDCCSSWEGITCDNESQRVIRLELPSKALSGVLSPAICNLTTLSVVNLSYNRLSGSLPDNFFSSFGNLQVLDLSYNRFIGQLPDIVDGSKIRKLDLSSNQFSGGAIPSNSNSNSNSNSLLPNLFSYNISNNSFTGSLPTYICTSNNSIQVLDFSYNDFFGQIPLGLGQCSKLKVIRAGFNNLSGPIPDDMFTINSLKQISFPVNSLTGPISESIVKLANLTIIELYSNKLNGTIPTDIGKLSNLQRLQLHINELYGTLPPSLNNCTKLNIMNLRVNKLIGRLSDFDFSPLKDLNTLDLGNNNFTGKLPESLYSCKSLNAVRFATNKLEGQISTDILRLQNLYYFSVSNNTLTNITGAIKILSGLKKISTVIISKNFMNEPMPYDEDLIDSSGFQNLQILALGGCGFTGEVPEWLVKLKNLEVVDLSVNQLTGEIPVWIDKLKNLFYIDLSHNLLKGVIPKELFSMPALSFKKAQQVDRSYLVLPVFVQPNNATNQQYNQLSNLPPAIYLKNNSITGEIPVEIGNLKFIMQLDLSDNKLYGKIPDQFTNLTQLEILDLSVNNLSGEIPSSLIGLSFLSSFDVANNNLKGQIPTGGQFNTFPPSSYVGNPGLCGIVLNISCSNQSGGSHPTAAPQKNGNRKLIIGLVVGISFGTVLTVTILGLCIVAKRRIIPGGDTDKIELDAISSHSYSGVHPCDKDSSLVILFPNSEIKDLNIIELLKATDNFNQANIVGCGGFGLVYRAILSDGTQLAVKKLSGDMGLMEREFKAEVEVLSTAQHENLVSLRGYCVHDGFRLLIYSFMENGSLDYWLHEKLDGAAQLDWPTRLKIARGASCYIPPEYGQAWVATLRGDVYSFGVVMLELLTGKRPMEVFKPKKSRELVGWVKLMRSEGRQSEIFDPILKGKGFEEEMLQVLDVACMCVNHNAFKRPTMKEVVDWLKNVGIIQRDENKG
ncbi:hypothetical protein ACFE04_030967 [Oxalis oulophora]